MTFLRFGVVLKIKRGILRNASTEWSILVQDINESGYYEGCGQKGTLRYPDRIVKIDGKFPAPYELLLEKAGVVSSPGTAFGSEPEKA